MNRVPLPAGTTLSKSFEYGLDINLGTYGAPLFQSARRISGWAPTYGKVTTDVTTYDDFGDTNEDVTGRAFAAAFTIQGNRNVATGLYLPELERILAAAKAKGEAAILDVRFYHKPEVGTPNPNDAGRAFVTVEATRQNTGNAEIETYSVSLTGKGSFEPIENPFAGWDATAPIVSSVAPIGAGDGELLTVSGTGLLGATSVTVGGVAVTDFTPISDGSLVAILGNGDAGDVPIIVTTPGGASTAYTFTRGA